MPRSTTPIPAALTQQLQSARDNMSSKDRLFLDLLTGKYSKKKGKRAFTLGSLVSNAGSGGSAPGAIAAGPKPKTLLGR